MADSIFPTQRRTRGRLLLVAGWSLRIIGTLVCVVGAVAERSTVSEAMTSGWHGRWLVVALLWLGVAAAGVGIAFGGVALARRARVHLAKYGASWEAPLLPELPLPKAKSIWTGRQIPYVLAMIRFGDGWDPRPACFYRTASARKVKVSKEIARVRRSVERLDALTVSGGEEVQPQGDPVDRLATGDELAAHFEQWLAEHRDDDLS